MTARAAAVWLVLFAAYAATLGLDAFGESDYGGDEPHYLLAAKSLVEDGDLDVLDEFRAREYGEFYPYALDRHGRLTDGRLHENHGAGFPLLIAPGYAAGGAVGVERFLAAIGALAGALGYLLARRAVPDPWAAGAALAVGLSPPLVAYGTAVYPELPAGAALAAAVLLATRIGPRSARTSTYGCFALLALLPWLGPKYLVAGAVVGVLALRRLLRAGRRASAAWSLSLAALSGAAYVAVNFRLYGGPTPYAALPPGSSATEADYTLAYLERAYRLVALFVDREYGLLRWAPVMALALLGAWALARARRARRAEGVAPGEPESVAGACALVLGSQLLVATFVAATMYGFNFPPRQLVVVLPLAVPLVALGLRRVPRTGTGLALIGVVASVWLVLEVAAGNGGLAAARPDVPWGPLEAAFPRFGDGWLPHALAAASACVLAGVVLREHLRWRRGRHAGAAAERAEGPWAKVFGHARHGAN